MRSTFRPAAGATRRAAGDVSWRASLATGASFALAFAVLGVLWLLVKPLTLLIVAIIIAQALMPVVGWLERFMPRSIATLLPYLAMLAVLAGVGWLVLPQVVEQSRTLIAAAPEQIAMGRTWFDSVDVEGADRLAGAIESFLQRFGDTLATLPFTVFNSLVDFVLVLFMSIYWLIATPQLHRFAMSLVPEPHRDRAGDIVHDMGSTMGGFVRGTVIDGTIVGILTWIGLTVIGLEYALLLAVIQGLAEFFPIVGPIVAAVPAILVGLTESPQQALIVAGFMLVLQQFEGNVLLPLIMRNQADVPPLLSLLAITAGVALGGLLGAIIAIPIAGALRIMIVRLVAPAERDVVGVEDANTEIGTAPADDED